METKEIEQKIKDSAKDNKVLRIQYLDKKNEATIRNVEPYEIRNGKLWAYCRKKKGIRQFDLNRIQSARTTHYIYFPKWPVLLNETTLEKKAYLNSYSYLIQDRLFGRYSDAQLE